MNNKGCAVVTGASRGIGAETAKALAKEGYNVIVNYSKSEQDAKEVLKSITESGGIGCIYKCDVSSLKEVTGMINFAQTTYGRIEVLVNNAGISQQKLFTDITEHDWNKMVAVNLSGVFYCCKSALPDMIRNKHGKIINISSVWGVYGASCEVHYSAVKAGVIGLTKALSKEVAPSGITVNAIAPGCILTDMITSELDENTISSLARETPLGRLGTPEDIAGAVVFLASKNADFITGQILGIDGGFC